MLSRRDQGVVIALCPGNAAGKAVLRQVRKRGYRRSSLIHRFNKPKLAFLSRLLRPLAAVAMVVGTIAVGIVGLDFAHSTDLSPIDHLNYEHNLIGVAGMGVLLAWLADQYGGIGVSVRAIAEFRTWLLGNEHMVIVEANIEDLDNIRGSIAELTEVTPVTFTLYEDWHRPNDTLPLTEPADAGPVTADRLRESARALAESQPVRKTYRHGRPLLKPLAESEHAFNRVRRHLASAAKSDDPVDMSGEWLLDNAYIIKEQIKEFRRNLPREFYEQVPVLAEGPDAGLPRIYGLAKALVSDADAQLSTDNILKFVGAYQSVAPLMIGELWALPMMLRFALIEHLHGLIIRIDRRQSEREWANFWANRLLTAARSHPDKLPAFLRQIGREEPRPTPHLALQIIEHLYDEAIVLRRAQIYIERIFATSIPDITTREQRSQAIQQVSLANTITSLRGLAQTDWRDTFESLSVVDMILRVDPATIYGEMDFETRDQYRKAIEKMARWSGRPELDVAHAAINEAHGNMDDVTGHVGYYLIDRGRWPFARKIGVRWPISIRFQDILRRHPTVTYVGSILALSLIVDVLIIREAGRHGTRPAVEAVMFVLAMFASSEIAIQLVNWLLSLLLPPRILPKLSFEHDGVPDKFKSMVVVPVMLLTPESIALEVERLEVRYLANTDPNLKFALLSDFSDAREPYMPEDSERLEVVRRGLEELDRRYGPDRFFLFHREREWSVDQQLWMGWERKRGKLEDLNRFLMGSPRPEMKEFLRYGNAELLQKIRFIITLDADTELPRETARRLVGTLAHPLNQPKLAPEGGRLERGYTIVQPRVSTSLPSAIATRFSRTFTDPTGVDPYAHAVTDTYQDLSGEGIYHGKGIYDLAAFNAILTGRFPDNHLLSHDLIEGAHARTALASDIELFDLFPKDYATYSARQHRWIRGDWQIIDWLFPTVPTHDGGRTRNPLSRLNRWKIFDNLRRSLVPLSIMLMLFVGWFLSPHPRLWSEVAAVVVLCPVAIFLVMRTTKSWNVATALDREPWVSLARALILIALLPEQTVTAVDAIVRVWYRRTIRHRGLLEWETSFEAHRRAKDRAHQFVSRMSWVAAATVLIALIGQKLSGHWGISVLLYYLLWCASPFIVLWLAKPATTRSGRSLSAAEKVLLREYARRTWRFFDNFVGSSTCWLPPDNYQEIVVNEVATRTSPTNIGLWLLSVFSAHDLGFLPIAEATRRLKETYFTLGRLERYEGHFLNWYETNTGSPLHPRYISMVDSGNLLGAFWTVAQAALDLECAPIVDAVALNGLHDVINILKSEADVEAGLPDHIEAHLSTIAGHVIAPPHTVGDLVRRLRAVRAPAAAIAEAAARLPEKENSEVPYWANQVAVHLSLWNDEIDRFLPWVDVLEDLPSQGLLKIGEHAHEWRRDALAASPSLIMIDQDQVTGIIGLIAAKSRLTDSADADLVDWLNRLEQAYQHSKENTRKTLEELRNIRDKSTTFASDINMAFLYDPERSLFYVGYTIDEHRMDNFYYDLVASEARLGSFCAVAGGKLPAKHWVSLGRPVAAPYGKRTLMSWNGTIFEYLMPVLLTKLYENTLLNAACENAVAVQIAYGKQRGVPWGISEAGFSAIDFRGVYQYYAFGVPGLGLRRQADDMLVVAPYASALALMVDAPAALQNLRRLAQTTGRKSDGPGMLGRYGFYESIDYSRQRNVVGTRGVVVRSYMAHHQGMTLVSIDNVVNSNVMQRRFHADARVRASESLLHERIPVAQLIEGNNDVAATSQGDRRRIDRIEPAIVTIDTWETSVPRTHMMSNGKYSVMVTNAGGGYSRWDKYDVTRWRSDSTRDDYGSYCFIRDVESNTYWSATRQPMNDAERPQSYKVQFSVEKAEIRRRSYGIEAITEIVVSPEDDAEIRRITLVNHSQRPRELELTSYVELALNNHEADRTHPAFSKLFVQTEAVAEHRSLIAWRRPKSSDEVVPHAIHVLALPPAARASFHYETARDRFIGRGGSLANPAAFERGLSDTSGAVLDPIFSLRHKVKVEPGQRVSLAFVTAAADNRNTAMELCAKYSDLGNSNRAFDLAWNHAQLDLRHLRIQANEAMRYQQLAGHVLYPSDALRANPDRLLKNQFGKSHLWAYGISGDLPIVTIVVSSTDEIDVVRQTVMAHAYWRIHGLTCDLVIVDQEVTGYVQPLNEQLSKIVEASGHLTVKDKPGGVFLRSARQIAPDDLNLLLCASQVVLVASRGALAQQIGAIKQPAAPTPGPRRLTDRATDYPSAELPFQELEHFNGLGGFSSDGKEYCIYLSPGVSTPAPWVNVIANPDFGAMVSESGAGTVWRGNSQSNRIIPWANDPVLDPAGDAVYIRDEDLGVFWTPTASPVRENDAYRARHGQGYSVFEHNSHGIEQTLTTFVPLGNSGADPVRVQILRLKNRTQTVRKLSVTPYVDWVLGTTHEETQPFVTTSYDARHGVLMARNSFNPDFGSLVAFLAMSLTPDSHTGDRKEFLGRCNSTSNPAAMKGASLPNRTGSMHDPCGALQCKIEMQPGEVRSMVIVLGEAGSSDEAVALAAKYANSSKAQEALTASMAKWDSILGAVQVETPDKALDALLNRWVLYQTISSRIWGRTGFYQSSGAYGFRDQLQDVLAVMVAAPQIAREQILRASARQFSEGDVQHWWHPTTGAGPRTRISDDLMWLPYVVANYVRVTGDDSILDETVQFLHGAPLAEDEQERYFIPDPSHESGTVLEHCIRAVRKGSTSGPHGLPLIGSGDWNDGLNRVGVQGKGESVWLGWFLICVKRDLAELLKRRDQVEEAEALVEEAEALAAGIDAVAWDGEWYLRGFYDDGEPLGSSASEEGTIDSLPQSWSVISNSADPARAAQAMESAAKRLVRDDLDAVLLFTPPFDKTNLDPGYIKGYVPGVRENGGQYTHGSLWMALAYARMGDGDAAVKLLTMMGPLSHTRDLQAANRYRVEPYVVVADIYSAAGHEGQGGWSWYTGAAGWMYNIWVTEVLGLRKRAGKLTVDPVIPKDWKSYALTYRHGTTVYKISVENPNGISCGVDHVELDGAVLGDPSITLTDDGKEHTVRVVLGDKQFVRLPISSIHNGKNGVKPKPLAPGSAELSTSVS